MKSLKCWLYLLLLSFAAPAVTSCNKAVDIPPAVTKAVDVAFFNLIPGQNPIDFYVDGTRENINKIYYAEYSGYSQIDSGQYAVEFKQDTIINNERAPLFAPYMANFTSDSTTLFVTGTSASAVIMASDTVQADLTTAAVPKLRFINASANSPAYDVVLNSVTITNQPYKSISPVTRIPAGLVTVKLNLKGTGTTLLGGTITLSASGVYTLFVYGSYTAGSTNGLNLGLMVNH